MGGAVLELFVLNADNGVSATTYAAHYGKVYRDGSEIAIGLKYAAQTETGRRCLFGPYADPLTLEIGPSTSSLHDEMTLLFIVPIIVHGQRVGMLCGRVPNDVVGDLIQR